MQASKGIEKDIAEDQEKQPSQDGLGVMVGAVGEMIVFGRNIERLMLVPQRPCPLVCTTRAP